MSDQVRIYFFGNIFLDWTKIMLNTQEEIWLCKISTTEPFDPRMFPKCVEEKNCLPSKLLLLAADMSRSHISFEVPLRLLD